MSTYNTDASLWRSHPYDEVRITEDGTIWTPDGQPVARHTDVIAAGLMLQEALYLLDRKEAAYTVHVAATPDRVYARWSQAKAALDDAKLRERDLRDKFFRLGFLDKLDPVTGVLPEGTTKSQLDGTQFVYKLTAKQPYERKVLEESIAPTKAELLALTEADAITDTAVDALVRRKPELDKKAYNALTDAQRAIVDKMLETKPGSLAIEVQPVPRV